MRLYFTEYIKIALQDYILYRLNHAHELRIFDRKF